MSARLPDADADIGDWAPLRGHSVSVTDATSPEFPALLQRRVRLFAGWIALLALGAALSRLALLLSMDADTPIVPPGVVGLQLAGGLVLGATWLALRAATRSPRVVRTLEWVGLLSVGFTHAFGALWVTLELAEKTALHELGTQPGMHLLVALAMLAPLIAFAFMVTYAMIVRAAFVPTGPQHTAWITGTVSAPLVAVAYTAGLGTVEPSILLCPEMLALGAALQAGLLVATCAGISKVIYGLRTEARRARKLGQYTLIELIGEGGMGSVYRARHGMLRRPTAVKLLPPDRAGSEALDRFEREVQLTAQLTHPNTVTIFDYGRTADGLVYYAMELLDGATLEQVVEIDGPQPAARVIRILEQVAGALGEAHRRGLVHRDIKPANIILCRQGGELDVAKVVDFGLVKDINEPDAAAVSQSGTISGTPLYMAPETVRAGGGAGPASDLYALGAVGYYLLTGEHVFGGESVIEVLGHHLHSAPEPPSLRLGDPVPEDLERLVLSCLAKDPADRAADAEALRRDLENCQVERWRQRNAARWWSVHEAELTEIKSSSARSQPRTALTVDLANRS